VCTSKHRSKIGLRNVGWKVIAWSGLSGDCDIGILIDFTKCGQFHYDLRKYEFSEEDNPPLNCFFLGGGGGRLASGNLICDKSRRKPVSSGQEIHNVLSVITFSIWRGMQVTSTACEEYYFNH
jgi:hypothetical protein